MEKLCPSGFTEPTWAEEESLVGAEKAAGEVEVVPSCCPPVAPPTPPPYMYL